MIMFLIEKKCICSPLWGSCSYLLYFWINIGGNVISYLFTIIRLFFRKTKIFL